MVFEGIRHIRRCQMFYRVYEGIPWYTLKRILHVYHGIRRYTWGIPWYTSRIHELLKKRQSIPRCTFVYLGIHDKLRSLYTFVYRRILFLCRFFSLKNILTLVSCMSPLPIVRNLTCEKPWTLQLWPQRHTASVTMRLIPPKKLMPNFCIETESALSEPLKVKWQKSEKLLTWKVSPSGYIASTIRQTWICFTGRNNALYEGVSWWLIRLYIHCM